MSELINKEVNGTVRAIASADFAEMQNLDRFQIIDPFEPGALIFDRNYWGGPRSDDLPTRIRDRRGNRFGRPAS